MSKLIKKINLYGLTMIAVGGCIGSGIFVTPYQVAEAVPNGTFILAVWGLGGLIALTGALTFAELGGMFPKAGGVYVFLKEAYGDLVGFLYGWGILLVINTGALAALGMALAEYLTYFFPLSEIGKVVVAIIVIVILTTINIFGVRSSQILANVFTGLKLLAIGAIILTGIIFFEPSQAAITSEWVGPKPDNLFSAFLLALVGVLWSFGGWHHASYLAAETINAKKTVPRAMILGTLIVTITYVLVNWAYMLLLPIDEIAGTRRVAGDAIGSIFTYGGQAVAIAIGISIFGTIGIYTMSAPRIYFAMAEDKIFFQALSKVHPKYKTPMNAMIVQSIWAIFLLGFWGTFHDLITYVTFLDIAFMAMAGLSVFIFRRKYPNMERPYKVIAYPIIPLIFTGISTAFVVNTLIQQPKQAWAGLILLGLGTIVFQYFKGQKYK
ncbi:MAG: amino acid permease [Saprospiraceae bacterium]|nr:amino acid permease [Saprospiraceae bacterium]